jgi:ABC-type uncharacterized transport system substrate-binding protein
MRRRELLGLIGSGIFGWSAAWAERSIPTIGFLHQLSFTVMRSQISAFWEGLSTKSFVKDRNVRADYRWAEGRSEILQKLALDLVNEGAAILVVGGDVNSVLAVKRATESIPIVFVSTFDPVRSGIVANMSHSGSNITGISLASTDLLAKRLEILHECSPGVPRVTVLLNPLSLNIAVQLQYLTEAADHIGISVQVVNVSGETDFQAALGDIGRRQEPALLVANDGFLNAKKDMLIALTSKFGIPAAFGNREFVEAGGLVSYGPSMIDAYRQAGGYVGRILNGENPSDLPIEHPIEFEIAVNVKTAKLLGLHIPPALLSKADEIIE